MLANEINQDMDVNVLKLCIFMSLLRIYVCMQITNV